jgi:hypothetical protein
MQFTTKRGKVTKKSACCMQVKDNSRKEDKNGIDLTETSGP